MDEDLLFLQNCSNDQLKTLADFLVFDKDGKKRLTETLSNSKSYINNYPNNMKVLVPDIIREYRYFGSNSILTIFKEPNSYKTILGDVCKKLKVPYHLAMPVALIEQQMLQTLVYLTVDKLTDEDVSELLERKITKAELLKGGDLLLAGSPLFLRIVTVITIQIAARMGLQGASALLAQFVGGRVFAILAGPVGFALAGLWAAFDIAGPAYRVTIPSTVYIAYYRIIAGKSDEEIKAILK